MNDKTFRVADYLAGNTALPAGFDTGYRHHLETAKEIVRQRQGAGTRPKSSGAEHASTGMGGHALLSLAE